MIEVKNITKSYGNKKVVDNVSLNIQEGKITSFIGPNGAGKSTLLSIMSRLLKRDSGEVLLDGKDILDWDNKELAKKIAILRQSNNINIRLTIRELVSFGRFPHSQGNLKEEDYKYIDEAIDYMQLKEFEDRYLDELSGGQRQRAWIAMTLAQETEIIMLDEPTTYLDMSYQLEVLEVLQKLNKEKNITVVIVLHELNNACRFADNIIGLKKGKIICQGRPLDVINKENLKEIYGIDANLTISEDGQYPICMEYDLFRGRNEK